MKPEAWCGFLQMKSQTMKRLIRRVTCPFFASHPPQIPQSSDIFPMLQNPSVIVRCSAKVPALRTLEKLSKRKGFFPPTAIATNGITVIPSILGGLTYHKGPWTRKKMIFRSATSNQQNERGICIWKNSRKHLAQLLRQKEKIKQVGKKRKRWKKFWRLQRHSWRNFLWVKKHHNWLEKNIQMCYILLWDQEVSEEKWT